MTAAIPAFTNPPVVETVMGIYFRPVPELTNIELTRFWLERLQSMYPSAEERSFLPTPRAAFGEELIVPPRGVHVQWSAEEREPVRLWLKNDSGERILQLQRTAILANWLRRRDTYVKFGDRLNDFRTLYQALQDFVTSVDGDVPRPKSCTVRYINHLPMTSIEVLPEAFQQTLCGWELATSDGWLPSADSLRVQLGYPFPKHQGRLDVALTPARSVREGTFHIQMDLTAAVNLREDDDQSRIWSAFDLAHEWVVRGFASLTRPQMHLHWGRTQ